MTRSNCCRETCGRSCWSAGNVSASIPYRRKAIANPVLSLVGQGLDGGILRNVTPSIWGSPSPTHVTSVNITKPGLGIDLGGAGPVSGLAQPKHMTIKEIVINIFPDNFFDSAVRGDVLEVVVFTIIFAIALSLIKEKKKPIIEFCEALAETMFKYTNIVMKLAPIGVGAAIAVVIASKGMNVLLNLCVLIATFYGAIIVFLLMILLPVALICKVPLKAFLAAVKEPAIIAFSTSSSEAALPKAMENMEALGVPRRVVSFVIPTGYSFNLDGTTIYLSLASVFAAQAAGIDLSISQQLMMGFTLIFASKGAAGVPRASLVVLAGTLASFGLPVAGRCRYTRGGYDHGHGPHGCQRYGELSCDG